MRIPLATCDFYLPLTLTFTFQYNNVVIFIIKHTIQYCRFTILQHKEMILLASQACTQSVFPRPPPPILFTLSDILLALTLHGVSITLPSSFIMVHEKLYLCYSNNYSTLTATSFTFVDISHKRAWMIGALVCLMTGP